MATTLRISKKLHVTPLCDIRHKEVANAYIEGLYDYLYNRRELVIVSHFVECLQRSIICPSSTGSIRLLPVILSAITLARCTGQFLPTPAVCATMTQPWPRLIPKMHGAATVLVVTTFSMRLRLRNGA
jgi:hypothetical protein